MKKNQKHPILRTVWSVNGFDRSAKMLQKPDAIFPSFKQDTLGSVPLDWSNRMLDVLHLGPGHLIAHELSFELTE